MREAPSRVLLRQLIDSGATVAVRDPVAMNEASRVLAVDFARTPDAFFRIRFCDNPMDALHNADVLAIVTEWKTFRIPDFDRVKALLKAPIIFDGRNLFYPGVMADGGFEYHGIGRSALPKCGEQRTAKESRDSAANLNPVVIRAQ
jgi:UDPglucose 6-dehydrogenase